MGNTAEHYRQAQDELGKAHSLISSAMANLLSAQHPHGDERPTEDARSVRERYLAQRRPCPYCDKPFHDVDAHIRVKHPEHWPPG